MMIHKSFRKFSSSIKFIIITIALTNGNHMLASSLSSTAIPKTALVTGATDGIGLTTAKNLAKQGYRVIVHGRDKNRIEKACSIVNEFASSSKNSHECIPAVPILADLSSISGCQQLISSIKPIISNNKEEEEPQLDLLVNNAGVYAEEKNLVGEHDLEETFAVNVLAPFVLTSMLLPIFTQRSKPTRIVIASSISQSSQVSNWEDVAYYQTQRFSSHKTYSESKLMDAMLTYEMAERLQNINSAVTVNCLDPGTVNTKMLLAGWGRIGINVERALDETWLSTSKDVEHVTGKYFVGRSERKSSGFAYNKNERAKLWNLLSYLAPEAAKQWDSFQFKL